MTHPSDNAQLQFGSKVIASRKKNRFRKPRKAIMWEYKHPAPIHTEDLLNTLNDADADGWELVSVYPVAMDGTIGLMGTISRRRVDPSERPPSHTRQRHETKDDDDFWQGAGFIALGAVVMLLLSQMLQL